MRKKALITGSFGLVGFECSCHFLNLGFKVFGIDNDSRKLFFGKKASTKITLEKMKKYKNYFHFFHSINNNKKIENIIKSVKPDLIIHCAAQPSHDKSAKNPILDFKTNSFATLNILDSVRMHCAECVFIFVSTNKVYGDNPNKIKIIEKKTRYEIHDNDYPFGINEKMSIDDCLHSPFGVSKASADLMVQEYGRYYNVPTSCFRCGCITGANHKGVELHGFLSHLSNMAKLKKVYTINGYKGKQVRDNIHALDLTTAFYEFYKNPKKGQVYNIGGGKENSCSILEVAKIIKDISGNEIDLKFTNNIRKGDHKCYYTDFSKFKKDYPNWSISKNLYEILDEMFRTTW